MQFPTHRTFLARGAVGAVALAIAAQGASAQSAGAPGSPPRRTESVQIRITGDSTRLVATIDSLRTLINSDAITPAERERINREFSTAMARAAGGIAEVIMRFDGISVGPMIRGRIEAAFGGPPGASTVYRELTPLVPKGWIGFDAQGPAWRGIDRNGESVRYLEHPVVSTVEPNSPAERAGVARGDLLLAYDGKDVTQGEINLVRLLEPDRRLAVTVRRDGDTREFNITVERAPANIMERRVQALLPQRFVIRTPPGEHHFVGVPLGASPTRAATGVTVSPRQPAAAGGGGGVATLRASTSAMWGAHLTEANIDLARRLGANRSGLLVTEIAADSPGYRKGLRTGDIILKAGGKDVTSIIAMRNVVAAATGRTIEVQYSRNGSTRKLELDTGR